MAENDWVTVLVIPAHDDTMPQYKGMPVSSHGRIAHPNVVVDSYQHGFEETVSALKIIA